MAAREGAARISIDDFNFVRQLMLEHTGILLEAGKEYLAESRLSALAYQEGFPSISALLDSAQQAGAGGALPRRVIESMTINETSFFRDLHPFEALRREVLPQLIEARADRRSLTIWSAACASGQEPYSVAMLLREHFPMLHGWKVRLIASDVSEAMLARARAGAYNQMEVNRGLPAPMLVRHFRKNGAEWTLSDDLRRSVEFHAINLAAPWPAWLPAVDLVLIRNVLFYFDLPTRRAILERVRRQLRPDGMMFLGSGETTLHLDDAFQVVSLGRATGYRPVNGHHSNGGAQNAQARPTRG